MKRLLPLLVILIGLAACSDKSEAPVDYTYPATKLVPVVNEYHGISITDNYRWLEDASNEEVLAWTTEQENFTHSITEPLAQRAWLEERFNALWRYDDETIPKPAKFIP